MTHVTPLTHRYKAICNNFAVRKLPNLQLKYIPWIPVGAPGDGGDEANIREKDGVVFDAIQGIVHLTERQSV